MKANKFLLVLFIGIIISNNGNAQLKVKTDGTVKIGSGTPWPDGGDLQIVQNNKTTEARVFATSPNIARFGALNSLFAYVFGIDASGGGFISGGSDGSVNIMKFNSTGSVGINYSPSSLYKLSVGGSAYCTGVWQASDRNLKEDITPISGALENLLKVNGMTYYFKSEKNQNKSDSARRLHYGFIAQDVKEIFPDLVQEVDDSIKSLALNYDGFIPLLIEALKEQQIKINKLEEETNSLKLANAYTSISTDDNQSNILNQNVPNPFNLETHISFSISSKISNASINIYNLQGTQIKSYKIDKGVSQIVIKGSELNPGIYLYCLIADGSIIDTKRMVLTE